MMKIVVLDGYAANPGDISWDDMKALGSLTVYDRTAPEEVFRRSEDADAILTNKVVLSAETLSQLPRLRYVGVLATGYNVVDVETAKAHGIVVTNVPAYSTESVAQIVFAHLLTVTNHTDHYAILNRNGKWTASPDFCYWDTTLTELAGKTFGIVGLGNIGQRVAAIANAFGMNVVAHTSKPADKLPSYIGKRTLNELLAESDVLSLHCPLTPDTKHLINSQTLELMKPTAILINTGRGPLINDNDVADALQGNRLRAFCADVLTEERPKDNPLLKCENAFITPHIAWATREARARLIDVAVHNVQAFADGQPVNVVV